jgi:hypothetical protein
MMKAICIADYMVRVALVESKVKERKGFTRESPSLPNDSLFDMGLTRATYFGNESLIKESGFYPATGVRFSGNVVGHVRGFAQDVFGTSLRNRMYVFINVRFENILVGVHDVQVYEQSCFLYKKQDSGNRNGVIVLKESAYDNYAAKIFINGTKL